MTEVKDCPFCNVGARVILQNDLAHAFLSDPRKVKGHFLVTTKRHVEKPWEITPEERLAVFELIDSIEQKLQGKLGQGFDIRQNYRPFLEETRLTVRHIHYHVIPRSKFDNIYNISERFDTPLFEKLTDQEREEVESLL